jgi:biopolymer transport protein ExbB
MPGLEYLDAGLSLLQLGGPVMFVLLAMSVLGLAIVIAKLYQFTRSAVRRTDFVDHVVADLGRDDKARALATLRDHANPAARVMEAAIAAASNPRLSDDDRMTRVSRAGAAEIRNLESMLGGLELIGNLSPLLGLLGTVFGMISAFAQLENMGARVDPSQLAGGIWEALLTTAFGLCVAIPALAAYYLFQGQVDKLRAIMRDAASCVLEMGGRLRTQAAAA